MGGFPCYLVGITAQQPLPAALTAPVKRFRLAVRVRLWVEERPLWPAPLTLFAQPLAVGGPCGLYLNDKGEHWECVSGARAGLRLGVTPEVVPRRASDKHTLSLSQRFDGVFKTPH